MLPEEGQFEVVYIEGKKREESFRLVSL